ncbi:isocitrate lyase/phosphoenolpyruvate mutase family protein [Priestia megaterium]|uniref:isocitrate lyase/PEP mutase family protein n=1 Tax=Priestia megaterium TaxID=1404 RepID=UPI0027321956|nr:isocitrate lyase/phosphoenolpyruvate mutase family protein [Priestia megaterium]MDP1471838.1 isocitrate lyase/phosphoenolpyruvate mutase family protein [Priestia megaterium]
MTKNQFQTFKELHYQEDVLYLFNCWDVMSAKIIESKGIKALATSSYAIADAWGCADGEKVPFEHLVWFSQQLIHNSNVPVSVDAEGLYADSLETLYSNAQFLFITGISGINFEDKKNRSHTYELWDINEQADRIRTLKHAATSLNTNIFINARTDVFFKEEKHSIALVKEALNRVDAYANAGADGIFIPGLTNIELIEEFSKNSTLPVNIMLNSSTTIKSTNWKSVGVSRVSYGPHSYFQAQNILANHLTFSN